MDARAVLQALITFSLPIATLKTHVKALAWDQPEELVVFEALHVRDVLTRFLANQLSQTDVERWADLIEMREGIAFQLGREETLKEVIFELSSPKITKALSAESATKWIKALDAATR